MVDTAQMLNTPARLAVEVCDWLTPAVDLSLLRHQPVSYTHLTLPTSDLV